MLSPRQLWPLASLIIFVGGCKSVIDADLSADGLTVYEATSEGLFSRPYDEPRKRTRLIAGAATSPSVSPDGTIVKYQLNGRIRLWKLDSGNSVPLPIELGNDCQWIEGGDLLCETKERLLRYRPSSQVFVKGYGNEGDGAPVWVSEQAGFIREEVDDIKLFPSGRVIARGHDEVDAIFYRPSSKTVEWVEFKDLANERLSQGMIRCRVGISGGAPERTLVSDPLLAAPSGREWFAYAAAFSPAREELAILGVIDRSPAGALRRYLRHVSEQRKKAPTATQRAAEEALMSTLRFDVACVVHSFAGASAHQVSARKNVPVKGLSTGLRWSTNGDTLLVKYHDAVATKRLH